MIKVWMHFVGTVLLDASGYPVPLGDVPERKFHDGVEPARHIPSAKITVWADKEAVLAFVTRTFKGRVVRDLGNRLEIDMPTETLVIAEVTVG